MIVMMMMMIHHNQSSSKCPKPHQRIGDTGAPGKTKTRQGRKMHHHPDDIAGMSLSEPERVAGEPQGEVDVNKCLEGKRAGKENTKTVAGKR